MRDWARQLGRFLRLGLPAMAVYALVLQAFLAGAAPAAPFDPAATLCADIAAGVDHGTPQAPGETHRHTFCVTHCGPTASPSFTVASAADTWLRRDAQPLIPAKSGGETNPPAPRHRGPGARAPPQA